MKECESDVLIVGAGAAGLMAAFLLAKAGRHVIVLEARNRCGGRIHTINSSSSFGQAELGAEFIHGDLPVTIGLLNEAGIEYHQAGGEMWHVKNGRFSKHDEMNKDWDLLMNRLNALEDDVNIAAFLQCNFPEDTYADLKNSVLRFAAGYDTADPSLASSFALRQEWQNEDEGAQHRIKGGYGSMIHYLEHKFKNSGNDIVLNVAVRQISWQRGKVEAIDYEGNSYSAKKVVIALPLGVLQSPDERLCVTFNPQIPEQTGALNAMGFGAIIKILLKFKTVFWNRTKGTELNDIGFILSDEIIPTWWTQAPQRTNLLTGWLGGPKATEMKDMPESLLLQYSLQSLSNIFDIPVLELKDNLVAAEVVNWTADPFTLGSYAYDTVGAAACRNLLREPVANTVYFAGEYLYEGPAMGTVEAALTSGQDIAKHILAKAH